MIVSESQHDGSKSSTVGGDGSVVASDALLTPPPYSNAVTVPQPSCNYLLDHKSEGSLKGTWRVDTSLHIPESLLPPITDFDGLWNKEVRKARKDDTPFPSEVRPNLMIAAGDGAVRADVHVVSSDGGPALIVVESKDGSVHLTLDVAPDQVSRINAVSADGEVKVWIPSSFEGALTIGTSDGSIKMSDGIKAKLTTFSSKSNHTRGFIGDWQAAGFGTTQSTNDTESPTANDPFTTWPGSAIRIDSKDGSVSLALIEEKEVSNSAAPGANSFKSFFGRLFGQSTGAGRSTQSGESPWWDPPSPPAAYVSWPFNRKEIHLSSSQTAERPT